MAIINLQNASPIAIKAAIANLKGNFNTNRCWVNPSNSYVDNTIDRINSTITNIASPNQEVVDYVAASVFIHSNNSWSYISAAINALMDGDYSTSIHNAYYAELRAIMSFLATQGIGVFDKTNVLIDSAGMVQKAASSSGTHVFAKNALNEWLSLPVNAESLIDIIKVEDKSINSWISATGFDVPVYMPTVIAKGWIYEWSIDMDIVLKDGSIRNTVSYRPQSYNLTYSKACESILERVNFIENIWSICSPKNLFEKMLWRKSLEYSYKTLFQYTDIRQLNREKDLKPIFVALGKNPDSLVNIDLMNFLERRTSPTDNLLFNTAKYETNPILESTIEPFGIISRAVLMASFATTAAQDLLSQTRTVKNDLQFWLDHVGIKSGYWENGSEPSLLSDLWLDVDVELQDLEAWKEKTRTSKSFLTPQKYRAEIHSNLYIAKQFNRSYLWNLGL